MLLYWKKFDKVEKEHRKKAEKEAQEQRKQDEEMREVSHMNFNYYNKLRYCYCFFNLISL